MAEVVSTGVSHMCDNSTVSVKEAFLVQGSVRETFYCNFRSQYHCII